MFSEVHLNSLIILISKWGNNLIVNEIHEFLFAFSGDG